MEGVLLIGVVILAIFGATYALDKIIPLPPSKRNRAG